ncbi:MAG TPA: hypothetical protein VF750_09055 [Sphingomicrobium sp.]
MNDVGGSSTPGHSKLQRQGPGKPWEVDVDIYLDEVGPAPERKPTFHLETCLPMDASGNIIFSNRHRPGFKIRFNLWDNTNGGLGSNYQFHEPAKPPHDPAKWALWSAEGNSCPPKDCNAQWADFQSDHIEAGGKTLVVTNTNSKLAYFGYTLRVSNDQGQTFVDLDPVGTNMNGATSAS